MDHMDLMPLTIGKKRGSPYYHERDEMITSLGESTAVFLGASGGDVAKEPPKTGRAAYTEENLDRKSVV